VAERLGPGDHRAVATDPIVRDGLRSDDVGIEHGLVIDSRRSPAEDKQSPIPRRPTRYHGLPL